MNGSHGLRRVGIYSALTLMALLALAADSRAQDPGDSVVVKTSPVISGTASVGSLLTASHGVWKPASATPSYQWMRCSAPGSCTEIEGASGRSYTITLADVDRSLVIRLIVTSGDNSSEPAYSTPTEVVPPPPEPPTPLSPPAITGEAREGELLTGSEGTWAGTMPLAISYGWLRCDAHGAACETVPAAAYTAYRLAAEDVGHTLRFRVTATNAAGEATTFSAPTVTVTAGTPTPVVTATPTPVVTATPTPVQTATPTPVQTATPATSSETATSGGLAPTAVAALPANRPALMSPFPIVRIAGRFKGPTTTFTVVSVRAPRGASIALSCRGRGCPFRRRALAARLVPIRALQRTFRAGAEIRVRVTAPGVIGSYTRIVVRRGRSPARIDRCLPPGSARPRPCPSGR